MAATNQNSAGLLDNVPLAKIYYPRNRSLENIPLMCFSENDSVLYEFILFSDEDKPVDLTPYEIHFQVVILKFRIKNNNLAEFQDHGIFNIEIFAGVDDSSQPEVQNITLTFSTSNGFIKFLNQEKGYFFLDIENNMITEGDHPYSLILIDKESRKHYYVHKGVISINDNRLANQSSA